MEKIDLHNYEAWFLDYSEGNLSEIQIVELNQFLDSNPEFRVELEDFEEIILEQDSIRNESLKASLLREETTGLIRAEYLMIAQVEGEISKQEKAELAVMVAADSSLSKDLAMYQKTKLPIEQTIVFVEKAALIQKERKIIGWWTYASAVAAASVVAFVIWNSNPAEEVYNSRGFAWQENKAQWDDKRLPRIVAAEKGEVQEIIEKVLFSVPKNQFAQVKRQKAPTLSKKLEKREIPRVVKSLEQANLAELPNDALLKENKAIEAPEISMKVPTKFPKVLAEVKKVKLEQDFVPIQKFAKDKIKKGLLKGKTFSETVIEEIADISNEKITFETNKDKGSLFESFALNIGKLSISRNR
jgi:hypothetical protein